MTTLVSCQYTLFIAADCDVTATETHTWVTHNTGIQQLICFVILQWAKKLPYALCVRLRVFFTLCESGCLCVHVCRWQLQPQTDWHLAVAVVLTAELTALIRTHPNQKETTPVHCCWAQPGVRLGGYEWRQRVKEMEREVIRSRWREWRGQKKVGWEDDRGEKQGKRKGGKDVDGENHGWKWEEWACCCAAHMKAFSEWSEKGQWAKTGG